MIHRNTTGPKQAPISAPKIGPVPAIFKSCTRNTFHAGIGMKSTPSFFAYAGVSLSSGDNTSSTSFPYRKYPVIRTANDKTKEIICIFHLSHLCYAICSIFSKHHPPMNFIFNPFLSSILHNPSVHSFTGSPAGSPDKNSAFALS